MSKSSIPSLRDLLETGEESQIERGARIIGYLPGCYPDRDTYRQALEIVAGSGIRAIEIGIPGAIGTLEGGVISDALQVVNQRCSSVTDVVEKSSVDVRQAGLIPIVMAFRDTVFNDPGVDAFVDSVVRGGASIVLVPDTDSHEYETLRASGASRGVRFVPFALASDDKPTEHHDAPFVYLQTADMPTGGDFTPSVELGRRIRKQREGAAPAPVGVGFGIRTAEDVTRVLELGADFAIIGTPMVEALNRGLHSLQSYLTALTQPGKTEQPGETVP
jgi:tryptophan synthase alpha subunit